MFKLICLGIMGIYAGITLVAVIISDTSPKRLASFLQLCALSAVLYYVWLT